MYTQAESLFQLTDNSLTDIILTLCASGHFGVREAIAAAIRQEPCWSGPNPSDASTTGILTPATCHRQDRDLLTTTARYRVAQGK
jgi:hypothetical protein